MAWQAGPAVYSGFAWEYPNGHLHKLWSEEQGMLIRISGSLCEQVWPNISLSNLRLTRLDLRVDVEEEINLLQWYQTQREQSGRVSSSIINDSTLYIGSRKSERFWRVYDKALEQGIPGPLYRIEVELKGKRARQALPYLLAGKRGELFRSSAIGIVPDLLDYHMPREGREYAALDLSLPRRPRAGMRFLEKTVVPFLERNPWAIEVLREKGLFNDGDM